MKSETKFISTWEEIEKIEPNDNYYIELDERINSGVIYNNDGEFIEYLSTHTFYEGMDKDILKRYGWNIELVLHPL